MNGQAFFDQAIAIARALSSTPEYRAYLRDQERARERYLADLERQAQARRDAAEKREAERRYDVWALNGGSDECTQFGIMDGCKPWCPVFERGACTIQDENEERFAADEEPPS